MLQFFHRNKRSVLGLFVALMIALSMAGWGAEALLDQSVYDRAAIQIEDQAISFERFDQNKRAVQQNLVGMYGPQALAYFPNLSQEIVDRVIADTLLERNATKLGLAVGNDAVVKAIQENFSQNGFQREAYLYYLQQTGMTSANYEAQVARDLMRSQYLAIVQDAGRASKIEAQAEYIQQNTEYSVDYVEFSPAIFKPKVADPGDQELEAFYEANSTDFEIPAKVDYEFVVFDPSNYQHLVEVTDDDIELEYSDRSREFAVPDRVKVSLIIINTPSNSNADEIAKARARADQALLAIKNGKPFSAVAQEFSDDPLSKLAGGEVGWVNKGTRSQEFDRVVFSTEPGQLTEVISTENGYEIAQIQEIEKGRTKALSEVRSEIESAIRKREAPVYLGDYVHGLLQKWEQEKGSSAAAGGGPLKQLVATEKLTLLTSGGVLSGNEDPKDAPKGLTKKILENASQSHQIVEIDEKPILVEVKKYEEAHIPSFAQARASVLDAYQRSHAAALAKESAQAFLDRIAMAKPAEQAGLFASEAKKQSLQVQVVKDIKASGKLAPPFNDDSLQNAVFGRSSVGLIDQVVSGNKNQYVINVSAIKKPKVDSSSKEYVEFENKFLDTSGLELVQSLIESMRARAKIDVNPAVLSN